MVGDGVIGGEPYPNRAKEWAIPVGTDGLDGVWDLGLGLGKDLDL